MYVYNKYDSGHICIFVLGNKIQVIYDFVSPYRELFIWAVLLHRTDLAVFFWVQGRVGILLSSLATAPSFYPLLQPYLYPNMDQ